MFDPNPAQLQPVSTSLCSESGDVIIRSTGVQLRLQRHEPAPFQNTDPSVAPRPGRAPSLLHKEELRTIQLAAGARRAGLEALRQRSQSAPRRREVIVKLLDSTDSLKQNSNFHSEPWQDHNPHNEPGQDNNPHNAPGAPQLDVERVAELTESIQKLLQTHRGQSLTEETMQRLETLHNQQLTLQNQLLDSALKMVMTAPQALPPSHLSAEPKAVPVEMLHVTEPPPCFCDPPTHSLSPANQSSEEATHRPKKVLREMKALISDQEEPKRAYRTRPTPSPSRENKPQPSRTLQNWIRTHRTQPQSNQNLHSRRQHKRNQTKPQVQTYETEGHQNYIEYLQQRMHSCHSDPRTYQNSPQNRVQNQETVKQIQNGPQSHQTDLQQREPADQENDSQYSQNRSKTYQINLEKKQNGTKSTQNSPEEQKHQTQGELSAQTALNKEETQRNLTRSKQQETQNGGLFFSGPVLPRSSSVSQRFTGRAVLDEAGMVLRRVQRQRKLLEENLESHLRTGDLLHCHINALYQNRDCSEELRIKKTVDSWISSLSRDIQVEMEKTSAKQVSAETKASANRKAAERQSSAPSGRARPLSTHRTTSTSLTRTSATGPTITSARVKLPNSPPVDPEVHLRRLYGKAPHEGLRRSLKRSPYLRLTSPVLPVSPDRNKPRPHIIETVRGVKLKSCKTQTCLDPGPDPGPGPGPGPGLGLGPGPGLAQSRPSFLPTAIPLAQPRIDSFHRAPQVFTSSPLPAQEVASQPRHSPVQEMTSPSKSPAEQEIKSLSKDVKEQMDPPSQISEATNPPDIHILQSSPLEQEEEEFPGTHFLSVADVEQADVSPEEKDLLQIEGGLDPDPVQNQGPVFPPQPPAPALPSIQEQAPHLGCSIHRDALESRLVQWVEQHLMSRMITEMYCPPVSDPVQNPDSLVQSDPDLGSDHSQASDLAHGDFSPQFLVDSGLDLDQDLVRGLVHEVLTETVAQFLGFRESQGPQIGSEQEPELGPVDVNVDSKTPEVLTQVSVQTPGPTPVHSPTPEPQTPVLSPVTTPAVTPLPCDWPSLKENPPPEPIATPAPSPVTCSVTCPDAELLLVQDSPEKQEEPQDEPTVVPPPVPSPDPGPGSEPPSPPDASSSSSSSPSSSASTAHAALKHISEGELLLSVHQLQAVQEGSSFFNSLHEVQEMELDPLSEGQGSPSEGQVRPHSELLSILKIQQREPRPQPEGSRGRSLEQEEEVSVGEIRDMRPQRNLNTSPGQTSPIQGDVFEWTNQSELSSDLHMDPPLNSHLTQTESAVHKQGHDLGSDLDQPSPRDHQVQKNQENPERNGDRLMKMQVFVPSVKISEEEISETDSSDVF